MENQTPSQKTTNPLVAHFRQPKISLSLPSQGRWWGDGALDLPPNGEIPIYAMTAKDEIALRTPDSLLNGTSVVSVVQSCCPNIKDAWQMPSVDLDAVLLAIRIASFGDVMDIDTNCPECKEDSRFGVKLGDKLAEIECGDYDTPVIVENLKFGLEPQQYFNVNRIGQIRFQEDRISSLLLDVEMPEAEKGNQLQASFQRLVDIGIENVTDSTAYIEMPDGTKVKNKQHILEFYTNSSAEVMRKVNERIEALTEQMKPAPLKLKCQHCEHIYQSTLEFDYTSFFGIASSS